MISAGHRKRWRCTVNLVCSPRCLPRISRCCWRSSAACAATVARYDKAAFNRALAAGVPLVVHVCAGWSPLCRTQRPIVANLLKGPRMLPVLLLNADFDADREARRLLHVTYQGTLIVFKDGREAARSSGDTDRTAIAALLNKAL